MSELKPHIVTFVETGIALVSTPEFSEVIRNAFRDHGLFGSMRARAAEAAAAAGGVNSSDNDHIIVTPPEEEEVEDHCFILNDLGEELNHVLDDSDGEL